MAANVSIAIRAGLSFLLAGAVGTTYPYAVDAMQPTSAVDLRDSAPAIAILSAASGECVGSGLIVGFDEAKVYAATRAPIGDKSALEEGMVIAGQFAGASFRAVARVVRSDASPEVELALLETEDPQLLGIAKRAVSFDVLGQSSALARRDMVRVVGCRGRRLQEFAPRPLLQATRGARLVLPGADLLERDPEERSALWGGVVEQVVGDHALLVGILLAPSPRAQALTIETVVAHLQAWKTPVMLTPLGTKTGCKYSVALANGNLAPASPDQPVLLSSGRDSVNLVIDTQDGCSWRAISGHAAWLSVSPSAGTGPGTFVLQAVKSNMCDGAIRSTDLFVAGRLLRIAQDGTNAGIGC